jgi:hypothetical protein
MVDRHDIDALLIGSLYGELSSADEARLAAHLEAHPTDRTALEGLTRTRDAVRTSRIFEVQLEPPQSVSALLVQEAVRRAPRKAADEGEGWFARLRRSFLVHPAMAAAAMMVMVVGVAGTLYLRNGDHFAGPEISALEGAGQSREMAVDQAPAAPPAPSSAAAPEPAAAATPTGQAPAAADPAYDSAALAKGTRDAAKNELAQDAKARAERRDLGAYRVGLADGEGGGDRAEQQAKPADVASAQPAPRPEPAPEEKPRTARAAGPGALLEVTTPRPTPKELDDDDRPKKLAKGRAQSDELAAAPPADPSIGAKRGTASAVRAPEAAPAAPAATALPGMKAPVAAGGGAVGGAPATGGLAEDKAGVVDADLAWARDQHSRLVSQVRAGRCTDAAGTAVALSSRAPGYYQQNVENDRAVKECLAYITAERERAAERMQRSRATTRRLSDEAAAPAAASKQATQSKSPAAKPTAGKSKAAPAKAAPAATKSD